MHARIYDFTLTAGGMQRLPVVGDFFKVISSLGTINVNADTGAVLDVMPGQGLREFPFNTLTITDKSGAANSGKILVGFSGMIDDRVTGEVSVIEGGAVRTRSGAAFAGANRTSAAAGQYPHVQLWNPAGSGKRAVVSEIGMDASIASDIGVRWSTAPLAALASTPNGVSKIAGGAVSACEVRAEANAAVLGTTFYGVAADAKHMIHKLTEPVILLPGYGLIVVCVTLATAVRGNFQFYEEAL